METITLTFNINPELCLVDNVKKLLKVTSLSALEFFTGELKSEKPGHMYSLSGLSILGSPSYVNQRLKFLCNQVFSYMQHFANGDDSFEEKMCQLEEVKCQIQEFRIENETNSHYPTDFPDTFLLHMSDQTTIDITLNQVVLNSEQLTEINQHLTIRDKHFCILENKISLIQQRLEIGQMRSHIEISQNDKPRQLQLLEVWIGLEEVGFLEHVPAKDKGVLIPKLRRQFFEIFQQTDINYKKLRSRLMERKYSSPDILPKMVTAFKSVIAKKVK